MSDAIWGVIGVIVGGIIGSIATIASILTQHRQWKVNRRIEYLQRKREKLIIDFRSFSDNLANPTELFKMGSEYIFRIPPNLTKEFKELAGEYDRQFTENELEEFKLKFVEIMGDFIAEIDKEIDNLTV